MPSDVVHASSGEQGAESPDSPDAPLSPRAQARRDAILQAAREVFVRDGYHDTKLTEVAKQARCSVGTLYTYFTDREHLLSEVLRQVEREMRSSGRVKNPVDTVEEVKQSISAVNRRYVEYFLHNAREMALLEQVAQIDDAFRKQRQDRARGFVERNARLIESLQKSGLVHGVEDPMMLAGALSVMVSRLAYNVFVEGFFGPPSEELVDRIVASVDPVWFAALGLD